MSGRPIKRTLRERTVWATGVTPPRSAGSPTPGNVKFYNLKPRRAGRAEG